jgi:hypothetical protein
MSYVTTNPDPRVPVVWRLPERESPPQGVPLMVKANFGAPSVRAAIGSDPWGAPVWLELAADGSEDAHAASPRPLAFAPQFWRFAPQPTKERTT